MAWSNSFKYYWLPTIILAVILLVLLGIVRWTHWIPRDVDGKPCKEADKWIYVAIIIGIGALGIFITLKSRGVLGSEDGRIVPGIVMTLLVVFIVSVVWWQLKLRGCTESSHSSSSPSPSLPFAAK